MRRRRLLGLVGLGLPTVASGCVGAPGTGSDDRSVSVTDRADQPAGPVEFGVEMVQPLATADRPARLRVTITNPTDGRVVLGEERAVQFHHVESLDRTVYLHPAGEGTWEGPVEPGCWRMTEYVAVPEYYGTVAIDSGESLRAESYVYGHPELADGACLPEGDHRLVTSGIIGDDEEAVLDESDVTEFEWGFTLRVGGTEA